MSLLVRHPSNPVLTAADVPFHATLVFNAGVTKYRGKYVMVFRNDYGRDGDDTFDGTNLGYATSDDGLTWRAAATPMITVERARQSASHLFGRHSAEDEILRFYDPRLTVIDDVCHICFALDTRRGVRGGIATTENFEDFEILSISAPDNRNMVLFPERIGGEYFRLERPFPMYAPYLRHDKARENFEVWTCSSPDLRNWGTPRLLLATEDVPFGSGKLGPAAPPVRTPKGWLTTFHAVVENPQVRLAGWEAQGWHRTYLAGLMLLDLNDPTRVIGMMRKPLLEPEALYETEGFRGSVVFPGGMILEESGEVKIYYGAADTVEALAIGQVDELLDACEPIPG